MRVVKIELEGMTTSFRYPHFLVGRQPSHTLPPPSTIFGHIASALGEFPADPAALQFGYCFRFSTSVDDLESQHILAASSGKLKSGHPKNLDGVVNPVLRQVLLWPRLTLYLAPPEGEFERYLQAFRQPRYAVVLGRSQDLATYTSVAEVELEERTSGYFEGTLLPNQYRQLTSAGILTQLPRYINTTDRRQVEWEMYLAIEKPVFSTTEAVVSHKSSTIQLDAAAPILLVDPTSPVLKGQQRAVYLHRFASLEGEQANG